MTLPLPLGGALITTSPLSFHAHGRERLHCRCRYPRLPNILLPSALSWAPLSATKLRNADFHLLIAKCDKYLAGWKGKLLSTGGRLVLTNAVLSSLPVYWMSSLLLPKGIIDAIDRRRRAFLWTGEETCSGARCLIAWDKVCLPKIEGGLGIKDLATQNHCLLLKFVHKLHLSDPLPWRDWILRDINCDLGDGLPDDSFLRHIVVAELQRYRAFTRVLVGNGTSTSFWFDNWLPDGPLYLHFPALFSHVVRPFYSVASALQPSLNLNLRPRLSTVASLELASLRGLIAGLALTAETDARVMTWDREDATFSSSAYRCLTATGELDANGKRIWATKIPSKVKFFAWLFCNDRLPT